MRDILTKLLLPGQTQQGGTRSGVTYHYDTKHIYTAGFSQNGMGAGYFALCFPGMIAGAWQGGGGM